MGGLDDNTLKQLVNLRHLDIHNGSQITDEGLSGLTNLHTLVLPPNATGRSVSCLTNLTALLNWSNAKIGNNALQPLVSLLYYSGDHQSIPVVFQFKHAVCCT